MKNKSIWKFFGIALVLTFLLTWIIPSGTAGTDGITVGSIMPTGFADIFTALDVIAYYFIKPSIFILFVGMFYGVVTKTGALKGLVDKVVKIFKNKKFLFIILTVLFYSVTTALTGIYLPMFMFVPVSIAILLGLKYSKVQSILATVGASTIGLLAQVSNAIVKAMSGIEDNTFIWVKVGLLAVLVVLTVLYILKINVKKEKDENTEEESIMFKPTKRNAEIDLQVKGIALFIVLIILFIVFVLGLTAWTDTEIFTKTYTLIQQVKIGEFAILDAILGNFEVFGSWTYNSLYPTIALAIILMSIVDGLKVKEVFEACVDGAKKVMSLAFLAALICVVVVFTLNSGFMGTIINYLAKGGNIALITLASLISSPFMVEMSYAAQYNLSMIYSATASTSISEIWGLIVQVTYSFAMLIAPTSVLLMVTLGYVEENYTKWFKYIWKFLLVVLIACFIAITIAAML